MSSESASVRLAESKLPRVGTTIFTVMSQLAVRHSAVNLGQGFPDFDPDPGLKALIEDAVAQGHNQYAPMTGVAPLREGIARKNEQLYGHRADADAEITVTAGATQAIMAAILAVVRAGDEVLVLEPAYDSYVPSILLAGGRPVLLPLEADRGYAPDWQRIRASIGPKTRLLIVNFPHNPSGRVLRDQDLRELESIVAETGIVVLSDEVYEHIVFDGVAHRSLLRSPTLAANSFVVSSFGKTCHTTGWKVGYACAPPALTAELRKVHQFMVFAVNTPAQHALARWLESEPWSTLPAFYQAKRDRFIQGLEGTGLRVLPCEATYFVLTDYSALSDAPDVDFAKQLIVDTGVASIPISTLYDQPVDRRIVRFCFAKREETLDQAIGRLQRTKTTLTASR